MENYFGKKQSIAIKGIAIIMLIFHHCFGNKEIFANYDVSFYPFSEDFIVNISMFFKICVSIFAFITGYGLYQSYKKNVAEGKKYNSEWIIGRYIKTMSGFWIVWILSAIIWQILQTSPYRAFFQNNPKIYGVFLSILDFLGLSDFFGTSTLNGTWWYMSAVIVFIICIPLIYKSFDKLGCLLTGLIIIAIPRLILRDNFNDKSIILFLFPVYLGMVFSRYNLINKFIKVDFIKGKYILSKTIKFIIEASLIVLLIKLYFEVPKLKFWELQWGFTPILIILFFTEFIIEIPGIKQILNLLGKHSMNIFLIHTFIGSYYYPKYIYSFKNSILIGLSLLIVCLIISIILEGFKKLIKYDELVQKVITKIDCMYEKNKVKYLFSKRTIPNINKI